jgi:hypothetical protein
LAVTSSNSWSSSTFQVSTQWSVCKFHEFKWNT